MLVSAAVGYGAANQDQARAIGPGAPATGATTAMTAGAAFRLPIAGSGDDDPVVAVDGRVPRKDSLDQLVCQPIGNRQAIVERVPVVPVVGGEWRHDPPIYQPGPMLAREHSHARLALGIDSSCLRSGPGLRRDVNRHVSEDGQRRGGKLRE